MAERRIDVLQVRWYVRAEGLAGIVPRWFAAAREHLPEALPRRFGDSEPLRGKLDRDGEAGVEKMYERADSSLYLRGDPPVHGGAMSRGNKYGPTSSHSLAVETGIADDRVRAFALALADEHTLYLSASIDRDLLLSGRTLVHDRPSTSEPYLAGLGTWLGLPPEPPLWCWFGPEYARDVPGERLQDGRLWTGGAWVPENLRARLDEPDPARRTAPKMPGELRRSPWRRFFGR
jgi:hypothetical protein